MDVSTRSKLSLCQLLALYGHDDITLLLEKYGLRRSVIFGIDDIRNAIIGAASLPLGELIQEIARTRITIRSSISPRYRFDDRWQDFSRCLQIDGYGLARDEYGRESEEFAPIEPIIDGVGEAEDDLTRELRRSGLAEAEVILNTLETSAASYRGGDFNGCLTNARVALQTLATAVAKARRSSHPANFDETKWGQVAAFLRKSGFIQQHQEDALTGVFSFLSEGAHVPIGFTEVDFTRLGRRLAVSFCYFIVKTLDASHSPIIPTRPPWARR
jgi:hypothetical protein